MLERAELKNLHHAGHKEDETEDEAGKENRPGAIQIWFHFSKLTRPRLIPELSTPQKERVSTEPYALTFCLVRGLVVLLSFDVGRSMFGVRCSMFGVSFFLLPSPSTFYFLISNFPCPQLSTLNKRQSGSDQLRKGAWLPRSFRLSTFLPSLARCSVSEGGCPSTISKRQSGSDTLNFSCPLALLAPHYPLPLTINASAGKLMAALEKYFSAASATAGLILAS